MKEVLIDKTGFFVQERISSEEKRSDFWDLVSKKRWEYQTFKIFSRYLDQSHSYIDMGAWIGPTALYGCQLARHCYAIEPDPQAFEQLKDNVKLNPLLKDRITLVNALIGPMSGMVPFGSNSEFGDSMSSMVFSNPGKKVLAQSITLEDLIFDHNITDCNFIKMDIEGGEYIVLPSIRNYLKQRRPTLLLSLHPELFDQLDDNIYDITDVLQSCYPYFYSDAGESLTVDDVAKRLFAQKGFSIVATHEKWPISQRVLHFGEQVIYYLKRKMG